MDAFKFRKETCTIRKFMTKWVQQNKIGFDPETEAIKWSRNRQSVFIESILLNVPLQAFYLHEDTHGNFITLDGEQRLYIIHNFMKCYMKLKFSRSNVLHGKYFSSLAKEEQRIVENCQLLFYILYNTTTEVVLDIIRRVH